MPSASRVAMLPTTLQIGDAAGPLAPGLAQRRQRVGRLARLRDDDRQRAVVDDRVAIAVLRAVVHLHRHAGQLLDQVLADEAGMPAMVPHASDDAALSTACSAAVVEADLVEEHAALLERDPAEQRLARPRAAARRSP